MNSLDSLPNTICRNSIKTLSVLMALVALSNLTHIIRFEMKNHKKAATQSFWKEKHIVEEIEYLQNIEETKQQQQQQHDYINNIELPKCIQEKTLCRYDEIGDFLENNNNEKAASNIDTNELSTASAVIHEPLPCIPSHRRIPHEKANDWPFILQQRAKLPQDGSLTALMDYNAFLIPLYKNVIDTTKTTNTKTTKLVPNDLDPDLLDRITGRYHPYFSSDKKKEEWKRVKYLSISRSSNLHSCKPKFKYYFGTKPQDFLGLSLLDENLQLIEGSDIAVNIQKWILGDDIPNPAFFDFQVVAVKTNNAKKKDQLFLFTTGPLGTYSFPMDIRRVPPQSQAQQQQDNDENEDWVSRVKGKVVPPNSDFQYGDGFQIRLSDDPGELNHVRSGIRADTLYQTRGVDRGKNFHFFEASPSSSQNSHPNNFNSSNYYMEIWPHSFGDKDGHVAIPINFSTRVPNGYYEGSSSELNLFANRTFENQKGKRYASVFHDAVESQNRSPKFSFKTHTKRYPKHERPKLRFRGTSQIIDMTLTTDILGTGDTKEKKVVKVGISHSVTEGIANYTDKRAYLSQFYAFSPDPPFEVLAISGSFCFNHMNDHDIGYHKQWISKRPVENRTAPILIMNQTYTCPVITFATGMTEMIGDEKNVIITYGVNDCYSRSIVVPKKKIEMLLFGEKWKE